MLTKAVPMIHGVDVSGFTSYCQTMISCWHVSNGTTIDLYCMIPDDAVVVGVSVAEVPYAGSAGSTHVTLSRAVSIAIHYMSKSNSTFTRQVRVAGYFVDMARGNGSGQTLASVSENPILDTVGAVSFKDSTSPLEGDFTSYSYHATVYVDDEYINRMLEGESSIRGYRVSHEHVGASFESLMADG